MVPRVRARPEQRAKRANPSSQCCFAMPLRAVAGGQPKEGAQRLAGPASFSRSDRHGFHILAYAGLERREIRLEAFNQVLSHLVVGRFICP